MGCPCSGTYEWNESLQALVCTKCGRYSTHQPMPGYEELLAINKELKAELERLKGELI